MLRALALLAQVEPTPVVTHRSHFIDSLISATSFGFLGMVLLLLGLKLFDWMTPKLDIEKELSEKNMAVAIVVAAMFISMGIILVRTVGG
jgi:putative membrane protein